MAVFLMPAIRIGRALGLGALLLAGGCRSMAVRRLPDRVIPGDPLLRGQVIEALARVRGTVKLAGGTSSLTRSDGYIYTVDVAQLLHYATLTTDSALYWTLRSFAIRKLLSDTVSDPYTRGFVLWRQKDGSPPDATGTTEGLRVAEGLWEGARVFGDTAARSYAVLIAHGYARHAYEDNGIWLIRNYFNFQNRSFATNSFLVDYDPDFLQMMGRATSDSMIIDVARRSVKLVRDAISPSGLLYELIQPEIMTALPELTNPVFGPNDIVSVMNSCTVAERVTETAPDISRGVLRFMRKHARENAHYYYGRTGEPLKEDNLRVSPMACLVRLAAKVDDAGELRHWSRELVGRLTKIGPGRESLDPYTTTEVLSGLFAAERWFARAAGEGKP